MNETLTALAVQYGWGCPTCDGDGETESPRMDIAPCPDCHGNRVTPSDADRFMDEVAAVVKNGAVGFAVQHDMLRAYMKQARLDVLDAMLSWPRGSNGPIAIAAYEALAERLGLFREQVWQRVILDDRPRQSLDSLQRKVDG